MFQDTLSQREHKIQAVWGTVHSWLEETANRHYVVKLTACIVSCTVSCYFAHFGNNNTTPICTIMQHLSWKPEPCKYQTWAPNPQHWWRIPHLSGFRLLCSFDNIWDNDLQPLLDHTIDCLGTKNVSGNGHSARENFSTFAWYPRLWWQKELLLRAG